jgi:hypothetical protein
MTFTGFLNLNGQHLTYRDFWALTLGIYAGLVIVTSPCSSWLIVKYGSSKPYWKETMSSTVYKAISVLLSFVYMFSMCILAIFNGLCVFGGESILMFLGLLIILQVLFCLVGVFVRLPYLAAFLVSALNWGVAGSIFFLIQIPSMFDYMSPGLVWLVAIAASIPLGLKSGVTYMDIRHSSVPTYQERIYMSFRQWGFYTAVLMCFTAGIVITFFMAGSCITVYAPDVEGSWIAFGGTVRWNSRMMRSFAPEPCPGPGPCHVYLTAGKDLTSEVFINVHLPEDSTTSLTIRVNNGEKIVKATRFDTPLLDRHDKRLVFSVFISGLKPGSENQFTLETDTGPLGGGYKEKGGSSKSSLETDGTDVMGTIYEFRTAPSHEIRISIAGDSGTSSYTDKIMAQMIATSPHIAVIGGDVAYDNGFISCACVWDKYISMWESKRIDGRFMVPWSFAAGNHDLGVNDNNVNAFEPQYKHCNGENIRHARPLLFAWFPFEVSTDNTPAPVCSRTTMRNHRIADLVNIWILDSAYAETTEANVDFVKANLKDAEALNLAVYHVPLYSSHKDEFSHGVYLQKAWVTPLFDRWGFSACFENHSHTYKRTRKLFGGQVSKDKGTIYLGDGKMGTEGHGVALSDELMRPDSIFEKTGTNFHFFNVQVTLPKRAMTIDVIDESGKVFDRLKPSN